MSTHLQTPARLWHSPGLLALLLILSLLGLVLLGHEGRRSLQMLALGLPSLLWLLWPLRQRHWILLRAWLAGLTLFSFAGDALVRAFLQRQYQAAPDGALVITASANTTPREVVEYLSSQGLGLLPWLALVLPALLLLALVLRRHARLSMASTASPLITRRAGRWLLLSVLLLCLLGYLSKPWRRHHPLLFWPSWVMQIGELRQSWRDQQAQRDLLLANARAAKPVVQLSGPSTVVLVLTDSVNRDNMSLYGYERPTTPQLQALKTELGPQLLQLRHAWSVEPGTLASLSGIFSFGERAPHDPVGNTQHLLALARTAGYKIWWMSNHDDLAVDQQHAQLAHEQEMINRQPGRASASLDSALISRLREALEDAGTQRQFIVVHLLGAHPHYRLRSPQLPDRDHVFEHAKDGVYQQMQMQDRPLWLRELRQDYDAALHYHDSVVAETLRLTRGLAAPRGHAAWMFLSDHGQEVGHSITHAGHSPSTPAGYRIPALLWRQTPSFDQAAAERPFRADWAAWTLAELLGLQWQGRDAERDVLSPRYAWRAPSLGAATPERFDR